MPINSFLYPGAKVTTAYEVANSCRFEKGDDAYMHKSSSGGNRRAWTISFWVKRSLLGVEQQLFGGDSGSAPYASAQFDAGDTLQFYDYSGSGSNYTFRFITNQVFRDVSAWSHFVFKLDTEQSTESNRLKIYHNGTEITSFSTSTYPSEDADTSVNVAGQNFAVANLYDSGNEFSGYMSEFCLIDGSALAPTSFGEFDEDSPTVWKPKDVSGLTFGTNGFYLDFEDSANLGNDANGGTDLTEVNLAAADQATDTPTNNFCTMNPLVPTTNITFSEGNCKMVVSSSGAQGGGIGTFGLTAGKWYWEVKIASTVGNHNHGAISENTSELYQNVAGLQNDTGVTCWRNDDGGEVVVDGTATTNDYGIMADGSIMGIALDMDNYNISYYDDGTALVTDFNMSTTRGTIFPMIHTGASTTSEVNFGGCSAFSISSAQSDANGYGNFEHAPPSGYLALCSKNLGSDGG
jgi:hypothetical protein